MIQFGGKCCTILSLIWCTHETSLDNSNDLSEIYSRAHMGKNNKRNKLSHENMGQPNISADLKTQ
jgi:hypothetical protein